MREPTAHKLQELVKLHAPPDAVGYCFLRTNSDNEVLRYPPSGCWKLSPFHVPFGVPNGVYAVHFFRQIEDRYPQAPKNPLNPFPQVPFFVPTGDETPTADPSASSPAKADAAGSALASRPGSSSDEIKRLRAELHAEMERQPAVRDTRIEYLQRQLALELQEHNQDLLKYGHYVAEVGGQFQLNRAYRMESQQAMETVLGLAKRTAEDAQNMMSVFRSMQELQVEALVSIKKQVAVLASPPPPPPPPDYSGTATAAVNLLRDVSVALIQLKGGASARPPELPATSRGEVHTAEIRSKGGALPASAPVADSDVAPPAPASAPVPLLSAIPAAAPMPAPAVALPPSASPSTAAQAVAPPPLTPLPITAPPTAKPSEPATAASSVPVPAPTHAADGSAVPPVATDAGSIAAPAASLASAAPLPTSAAVPAQPAVEPLTARSPSTAAATPAASEPQASNAGPAEPALGLAEKLIVTAMECQQLEARVDAGAAADALLPEVSAPKVEPPRSLLVDTRLPPVTPLAESPTSASTSQKGAGWLDLLRWMFASQRSAIEQRISGTRGKGKP